MTQNDSPESEFDRLASGDLSGDEAAAARAALSDEERRELLRLEAARDIIRCSPDLVRALADDAVPEPSAGLRERTLSRLRAEGLVTVEGTEVQATARTAPRPPVRRARRTVPPERPSGDAARPAGRLRWLFPLTVAVAASAFFVVSQIGGSGIDYQRLAAGVDRSSLTEGDGSYPWGDAASAVGSAVVDLVGEPLTLDEQRAAGEDMHASISAQFELLAASDETRRVERVAEDVLPGGTSDLDYSFHVYRSDEINAFTHVGGYVYVSTGLLDFVTSDEELQFVIGHEIAHSELGHTTKELELTKRTTGLLGVEGSELARLGYGFIAAGYSESHEMSCDRAAYLAMRSTGASKNEALSFMRRYSAWGEQYATPHGSDPASDAPLDQLAAALERHLRTHPPADERLEHLLRIDGDE